MGKFQPAKVNPEIKQYYVFDNFSGGINTTSSDDKMSDAEFRELINVDLSEYGSIKNRKGWASANINKVFTESFIPVADIRVVDPGLYYNAMKTTTTPSITISAPSLGGTQATARVLSKLKSFSLQGASVRPFDPSHFDPYLSLYRLYDKTNEKEVPCSIEHYSTSNDGYKIKSILILDKTYGYSNNLAVQFFSVDSNDWEDAITIGGTPRIYREITAIEMLTNGSGYTAYPELTLSGMGSISSNAQLIVEGKFGSVDSMVPTDEKIVLVKLVRDDKNIFDKLSNYDSTDEDFLEKFYQEVPSFYMEMLFVSVKNDYDNDISKINVRLLIIKKSDQYIKASASYRANEDVDQMYPVIASINLKKEITGKDGVSLFQDITSTTYSKIHTINSFINKDKVYFLLNEINNNAIGIGVYDIVNYKFDVIYNDEASLDLLYKPIPYEITNIGYNTLAYEPIEFIDTSYTSIKEIREIQLTKYGTDDIVITKIPSDGKFRIIFLLTGAFNDAEKQQLIAKMQFRYPNTSITATVNKLYNTIPFSYNNVSGYASNLVAFDIAFDGNGVPRDVEEIYIQAMIGAPAYGNNVHYSYEDMDNKYKLYNYGVSDQVFLVDSGHTFINSVNGDKVPHRILNAYQKTDTGMVLPNNFDDAIGAYPIEILEVTHDYSPSISHSGFSYFYYTAIDKFSFFQKGDDENPSNRAETWSVIPYTIGLETPVGTWPTKFSLGAEIPVNGSYHMIDTMTNPTFFQFSISDGKLNYIQYTANLYQKSRIVRIANTEEEEEKVTSLLFPNGYNSRMKMTFIQNRMVLYSGNSFVWSEPDIALYIPNNNFVRLDLDLDDEITGISYFRGSYLIFTNKRIYKMSGQLGDVNSMSVILINDSIGCIAPNSIRSFQNTVMFMSVDGLYRVKQPYYTEGLENVEKVDLHIKGLLPYVPNSYSYLNSEQYHLFLGGNFDFDALRYYYEMPAPSGHPFVTDKYAGGFSEVEISVIGTSLYAIKDGLLYVYNTGYYDFLPSGSELEDTSYYEYKVRLTTSNNSFGYTTHDKKIKKLYIKIDSQSKILIGGTVFIDKVSEVTGSNFKAIITDDGRISYEIDIAPNMESHDNEYSLDEVVVNTNDTITPLDVKSVEVIQLPVNGKGKNVMTMLETIGTKPYTIQSIGYTFKLGKVRADRRS